MARRLNSQACLTRAPGDGAEVIIAYELGAGSNLVTGSVKTDEQGEFTLLLQSTQLATVEQPLTVYMAKKTGNITHVFSCDGIPCTSKFVQPHGFWRVEHGSLAR